MSLINEALKKAQRLRNEDTADPSAQPSPAGVRIAKRGKAHSANTMVLIASGAVVLVVLSVVITVYLGNRTSDAVPRVATPSTASQSPKTSAATPEASPAVTAPVAVTPLAPTAPAETTPSPATATTTPTPTDAATSPGTPPPETAPAAATPPAVIESTPASPPAPVRDERVAAFVEAVRVTGIRSSGSESRVLMNDRVYRVNDVVDRTLGVRLVKVATDSLTFADPKGMEYIKNF
jgi:hypothetical protein